MRNIWAILGLTLLILGTTACSPPRVDTLPGGSGQPVQFEIETRHESDMVPEETMISQADAIFLGRVDFISDTIWHEQGPQKTPTHFVAVTVLQPIVDEVGLGQGGVLTLSGRSPLDTSTPTTAAMRPAELPDHQLNVGEEVIFFVQESDLAWGDHNQTTLTLFSPASSAILAANQLDQLIVTVARQRPVREQPQSLNGSGAY